MRALFFIDLFQLLFAFFFLHTSSVANSMPGSGKWLVFLKISSGGSYICLSFSVSLGVCSLADIISFISGIL